MMLALASDALRNELAGQRAVALFADRIKRLREQAPELLAQIEQAQGISLAQPLPRHQPRELPVRQPPVGPAVRQSTAFATFYTPVTDPVVKKRIVLARKMARPWLASSKIRREANVLKLDIARRVRGAMGGGGAFVSIEVEPEPEPEEESMAFPMLLFSGGAS